MAAIVVVLSALTMLFGERIGVNAGMGWDGEVYVRWTMDFRHQLFEFGTTKYQAQRVLPSAAVHYAMRLLGVKLSVPNIITGFQVFNAAMLVGAAVLWAHLGSVMKWREAAIWVGFVALFGCFANARHALYYPALTDTAAFALGMAMTWAYLARHPIVLWVCAALGVVTWPGLPPIAMALLVLHRQREPLPEPSERWSWWLRVASVLIVIAVTGYYLTTADHYYKHPVQELGIPKFATWIRHDLLAGTTMLLVVAMGTAWYFIVHQPRLWNVGAFVRRIRWPYLVIAVIASIAVVYARGYWIAKVGTTGAGPPFKQFVCLQVLEALRGPLWGPVHHVVYFGPIFLVAALRWRAVCRVVGEWGHGAAFAFAILVVFFAASESRQWIHLFPLLVAATIAATDAAWTRRRAVVFAALALAWSKLWFVIDYDTAGLSWEFPLQRYFMHLGPWATDYPYLGHLIAAVATAVGLYFLLRKRARS